MRYTIILVLLATLGFAEHIDEVIIDDIVNSDLSIREEILIRISGNTNDSIALSLPTNAQEALVNGLPVETDYVDIPLDCTDCEIVISYTLPDAVRADTQKSFIYERTLNLPLEPDSLVYNVVLPAGYFVSNDPEPDVVPTPQDMHTDGNNIVINWAVDEPQFPMRYYVKYYDPDYFNSFAEEIIEELNEWAVWVVVLVMMSIAFVAGLFVQRRFQKTKTIVPGSLLSPDENAVIKVLKEHDKRLTVIGGLKKPMNQKAIAKELDWSKSKVSAVVHNLQYKKIISREKQGRTYFVKLEKISTKAE